MMVTVAFTDPLAGTVALTVGQVAPVMDAGRLQAMFTCPVKPPTEVKVACVVPDCPGAEIVMLAIGPIVNGAGAPIVSATVVVAVKAPEVPVIVTVVGPPAVAELLAVSVSTLELAELVGLNDAVTPLGRPLAAKLTLPVNPPTSVTVMVLVTPAPPGVIVILPDEGASVKPGAELTVRATVVVAVKAPEVPVIVTVVVPAVADPLAVSVSTLVVAVLVGLNDAVTPLGRPLAMKLTLPVNPPTSVTVMVLVPTAPPGAIVTLPGAAARVKLAAALTTMGTELLCPAVTA